MKYKFNYEKWYNNNAKIVEKSIELNAFQFERFYDEVHKRDGVVFCNNPDWNYYVGEILVDKNSIGSEQNVLVCVNQCDCDLFDDSVERRLNDWVAWLKEYNAPMSPSIFLDKDEYVYGKSILLGVLPEAKHVSVPSYEIDKVYPDEKAKTTVDGLKKVMKCAKGEPYCVDTAVAYAIAEKIYGSNSAFSKAVERALPKKEKVFSYELWKNNNKVDCGLAKSLDGKTIKEISKAHKTEFYLKEKALIVDGEFSIDLKKDLK